MQLTDLLNRKQFVLLDGGMGTMLQAKGLPLGVRPETVALTDPAMLTAIHAEYFAAGAQVVMANTFGASAKKLMGTGYTVEQVVPAAIRCAKCAAKPYGGLVALDVGPLGELLAPAGTLSFEDAYAAFRQIILAGRDADLIVFETFTDLYEVKAALLAAAENSPLPAFVSMSFEANGRTFTGCTPESFAATAAGLGAAGVGINCSLGPVEILPLAKALCATVPDALPVFVKPNAGLPRADGSGYDIDAVEFARQMADYASVGVSAVGGCCGTTPEFIRLLAEEFRGLTPAEKHQTEDALLCTPTVCVRAANPTVVGERINPTGKKRFQQALRDGDMDYIVLQAVQQADAGAQVLDVNVGLPDIDEKTLLPRVVRELQAVVDLPLQLDSSDAAALEAALRVYNGKPVVNSVNGEQKVLDAILPLCKKYGAAVVGLTLDENGIPPTAQGRFAIAEKIVAAAVAVGIPRRDVYIDCLTLTASAQQEGAAETLRALALCKQTLGVHTALGVSNISFGLPARGYLNTTFLTMAMAAGLDLAIINPNMAEMMAAVRAFRVLTVQDKDSAAYIEAYANAAPTVAPAAAGTMSLQEAIFRGLKTEAAVAARLALADTEPLQLVNAVLIPALDAVGADFETGKLFLPQLLQSAGAAQSAFAEVKEKIAQSGNPGVSRGTIVLATVKGDIHDIGKNIVKVILENYGYTVHDLGRDVPVERVLETVRTTGAPLVGLSALMTTTVKSMAETIEALHAANLPCKIMVGGAVLTPEYAAQIGADYYARDAKASADIAKALFAEKSVE